MTSSEPTARPPLRQAGWAFATLVMKRASPAGTRASSLPSGLRLNSHPRYEGVFWILPRIKTQGEPPLPYHPKAEENSDLDPLRCPRPPSQLSGPQPKALRAPPEWPHRRSGLINRSCSPRARASVILLVITFTAHVSLPPDSFLNSLRTGRLCYTPQGCPQPRWGATLY